MEFEYCSEEFKDDPEWIEAIKLCHWRSPFYKGHYVRKNGIIYFDNFTYNVLEVSIIRRRNIRGENMQR